MDAIEMRFVPPAGALEIDGPFRITQIATSSRRSAFQSSPARGGVGNARQAPRSGRRPPPYGRGRAGRLSEPMPGRRCSRRKPATRSRGFSTNRSRASMSLIWAASRNFSPPNFTKGMFRRVNSISSGPLWLDVRNRTACSLRSVPDSRFSKNAFDDEARLVGLVAHRDELRLLRQRSVPSRGSW